MVGAALQQHLVSLGVVLRGVVLLGVHHAACRPVVELIDDFLNAELTLHPIQLLGPLLQALVAVVVHAALARHHLEVGGRQGDASEAGGQTAAEVLLVDLLLQRDGCARVDEVPRHVEVLQYRVVVRVRLAVLLVVEGLQLQRLLVNPRAALLNGHRVVQLRVEGQHVQLHILAVHVLHRVHHVLNKLRVRGTGRMYPDDNLRLLGLLLVGALGAHLFTIGVDGVLAHLVGSHDGCSEQLKETGGERLTAGRVADYQRRVVQTSQLLWAMVEAIRAACHQRHHQATSHKQRCWILVAFQALRDVPYQREVLAQRLYLLAPVPEPAIYVRRRHRRRRRLRPFGNLCIRLARRLGDSILHGLTRT